MRAVGIICEYNPFHNGHKYQIEQAKKLSNCDVAVCVMSGSFVQRGDVATFDKWSRAKVALQNGADLVIELPVRYVLQSAEIFARGGVEMLKATGCIDAISFGSECGDREKLVGCAKILANEDDALKDKIESLMNEGKGYPVALREAVATLYPHMEEVINNPNDMLGVNYIAEMIKSGADFEVYPITRQGADHRSEKAEGIFASSTAIRNALAKGDDISSLVPSVPDGCRYDTNRLEQFILGFYRTADAGKLKNIPGIEDGFENKLITSAKQSTTLEEFFASLTSKRYTSSRVKRTVLAGLIGMEKETKADYIRVLGMTEKGAAFIKNAKDKATLPFVVKTADFEGNENSSFIYDILATDISSLAATDGKIRPSGADYYNSPVKI